MSGEVLEKITNPAGQHAGARSRVYAAFTEVFEYPDEEYFEAVRSGALAEALREVLENVDPSLFEDADLEALSNAGEEEDDLAVEFTRLFDVGGSGPPCPLYGGLYGGARMKTMEEAVRFYNHFGLTLSESPSSTSSPFARPRPSSRATTRVPTGAHSGTSSRGTSDAGSRRCARRWSGRTRCPSSSSWCAGSNASSQATARTSSKSRVHRPRLRRPRARSPIRSPTSLHLPIRPAQPCRKERLVVPRARFLRELDPTTTIGRGENAA
jgi:hypothetical protein